MADQSGGTNIVPRDKLVTRWGALKTERASWWMHWQEISAFLLPRSGRFFVQDRNKGWRRHNNIYDNTGTRALRILGAGMLSGATSPARPWFRLATADRELNEYPAVKLWLADVSRLLLDIFTRSNTYRALHSGYEELGAFGTWASVISEDFDDVIHHTPLTTGECCIGTDMRGRVVTLYREFQKTVEDLVGEFGRENCSLTVRNLYDRGSLDSWVTVIHAIEPRSARDPSMKDSRNMAWRSCYFELNGDKEKYLRESGFKRFPVIAPRWAVTGGDIYGHSPGMECLGDVKQLQHEQLRKAEGIDYQTKPPLQVPTSLKNREIDALPGGVTFYDANAQTQGIRTMFDVNLNLDHLLVDIQDVRERIRGAFHADLFMMLANQTDTRMTATEVAERHEEKLLMLGPVIERLHDEALEPLVESTFYRALEAGLVPPPPAEMQNENLNVEFISMLAQAQRAVATNSVDRFVGNLGAVAQYKPDVLDKFDSDKWADIYSEMLGVDPELIVPSDKVAIVREQRAKQAAAAQSAETAKTAADAVNKLAGAQTTEPSALSNVINMFSGYNS